MKFDIVKIASLAGKVLIAIIQLVPAIEQLKKVGTITSNAEARNAVIDGAMAALMTAEGIAGHDLVNDAELRKLAGIVVDAVVGFHNAVAKKSLQPTG